MPKQPERRGEEGADHAGVTRRTALSAVGTLVAALGVGSGVLAASAVTRPRATSTVTTPRTSPLVTPRPVPPPLTAPPAGGVQLHPAQPSTLQGFVHVPETDEWFTTQTAVGTSALTDAVGLAVGDIVISRLAADGSLLDSMTLPDAGHGMGLVVRVEGGARVVTSCWYAPDAGGRWYDLVRLPYAPGTAARAGATTIVPGNGFPLDPSYDASGDAVTLRHQGGGGPEFTRHRWADFAAGDLSTPTGAIATPDSPPTHQGFCSAGDRFFFYTGAASDSGGDPALITEYDWGTGQVVGPPLDASGNSRLPDGSYPGGRMEPEGAAIVVDGAGAASLLVGVSTGGLSAPRTYPTFRYPLAPS